MTTTPALTGSCACGAVRFTSTALPSNLILCHCQRCRKISGAPFIPWAALPNTSLHWQGAASIRIAASPTKISGTPIAYRGSCGDCGSPLFMKYNCYPEVTDIPMGSVDDESVKGQLPTPPEEIFLKEKAGWWRLVEKGEVTRYESGPESFGKNMESWAKNGALKRDDVPPV